MAQLQPKYFWDTSIFLMVLKGEECHGIDVLKGACAIFRQVEIGEVVVVASELVKAEVLASSNTQEAYDKWEACLQWENFSWRSVDHRVAMDAAKLQSTCAKRRPKVMVGLADSVHVATFLLYSDTIDELHSVDGDFKKALLWSGSSKVATVPRNPQISMESELFTNTATVDVADADGIENEPETDDDFEEPNDTAGK